MRTIFISFENYQELHELTLLVKKLRVAHSDWVFILFDTTPIYLLDRKILRSYVHMYDEVIEGENSSEVSFKILSFTKKLYIALLNTLKILNIFKKYEVDLMLTGVPLVFFRIASFLKQDVFNIVYMRALIVSHGIEHSFSNKLDRKINKIHFLKNFPIFDSWYCNLLVTVSDINCNYYLGRGMDAKKIKVSGSLLLDEIKSKININCKSDRLEIIFLTYAAAYHENEESHFEQILIIKKLIFLQNTYGFNLTIRVHPRDCVDEYYSLAEKNKSVKVDTSSTDKFLMQCKRNKVVVSAFSTLNFEWSYLGGNGCFYTTENLYSTYGNFYKVLDLSPYFDIEKMIQDIVNNKKFPQSKKVYTKHKDGNIHYFVDLIEKVI